MDATGYFGIYGNHNYVLVDDIQAFAIHVIHIQHTRIGVVV
jgi:hypothetical protein